MEIIVVLIAISGVLAASGVAFFLWMVRQRSHEHADRMSFLPIEEDTTATPSMPSRHSRLQEKTHED